ncbi:MAG: hypothetical protein HOO06_03830 [Bdellovibrionaceae bacterium]|jgi:hypothetical protein|nr:hypothetical protein [Pseudobdellovibrionaceae bacterium]
MVLFLLFTISNQAIACRCKGQINGYLVAKEINVKNEIQCHKYLVSSSEFSNLMSEQCNLDQSKASMQWGCLENKDEEPIRYYRSCDEVRNNASQVFLTSFSKLYKVSPNASVVEFVSPHSASCAVPSHKHLSGEENKLVHKNLTNSELIEVLDKLANKYGQDGQLEIYVDDVVISKTKNEPEPDSDTKKKRKSKGVPSSTSFQVKLASIDSVEDLGQWLYENSQFEKDVYNSSQLKVSTAGKMKVDFNGELTNEASATINYGKADKYDLSLSVNTNEFSDPQSVIHVSLLPGKNSRCSFKIVSDSAQAKSSKSKVSNGSSYSAQCVKSLE